MKARGLRRQWVDSFMEARKTHDEAEASAIADAAIGWPYKAKEEYCKTRRDIASRRRRKDVERASRAMVEFASQLDDTNIAASVDWVEAMDWAFRMSGVEVQTFPTATHRSLYLWANGEDKDKFLALYGKMKEKREVSAEKDAEKAEDERRQMALLEKFPKIMRRP